MSLELHRHVVLELRCCFEKVVSKRTTMTLYAASGASGLPYEYSGHHVRKIEQKLRLAEARLDQNWGIIFAFIDLRSRPLA